MSKYSFDSKKKVVREYLNGEGGWDYLAEKYKLGTNSQFCRWVSAYQHSWICVMEQLKYCFFSRRLCSLWKNSARQCNNV